MLFYAIKVDWRIDSLVCFSVFLLLWVLVVKAINTLLADATFITLIGRKLRQ
jgi:hypothetical protein